MEKKRETEVGTKRIPKTAAVSCMSYGIMSLYPGWYQGGRVVVSKDTTAITQWVA